MSGMCLREGHGSEGVSGGNRIVFNEEHWINCTELRG